MRTCLTSAAIAAVIVFGLDSVGWGQQQQGGGGSSGGVASAIGPGGGEQSSMFSGGFGGMDRLPDMQSGDFVGASVEDIRAAMTATGAMREGATGRPRQTGRSGFGSSPFGRALQAFSRGFRSGRSTGQIRARVRLGFSVPRPGPTQLAQMGSKLGARLEKSSWVKTRSPVEVTIENDTAILRGVVATDHDRRLAERMARLEPGIRQVDNQLTVAQPAATPAEPAT